MSFRQVMFRKTKRGIDIKQRYNERGDGSKLSDPTIRPCCLKLSYLN